MKKLILLSIATAGLMTMGSSCTDTEETPQAAAPEQIDRMGRAAINTAISDPFQLAGATEHGVRQQDYNSNDMPTDWDADYGGAFRGNIAILDSLDTNCGNQFAAGADGSRYNALSGVLTDDKLYVNTASGSCSVYLAVEANATGIIENTDCGGRTPLYDTVDVSYSVLANGSLGDVGDGISADLQATHSTTVFPFLAAPNMVSIIEESDLM